MGNGSKSAGSLRRPAKEGEATDRRIARETSVRFDSPRIHQQSHEGTQGSTDCRGNRITTLIPQSSGIGTHHSSAECTEAARIVCGSGRYKLARNAMRWQGRTRTGNASLPHVKLSPMSAPGSYWQTAGTTWMPSSLLQEPARGDICFGSSTFSQSTGATGDLPEECRFLLNTHT